MATNIPNCDPGQVHVQVPISPHDHHAMAASVDLEASGGPPRASCGPPHSLTRLTYFEGWGLAEQTRWVLAATNVDFEQVALTEHEQFTTLRDEGSLLFKQLPLLEIDGLKLTQSQAMTRYVARKGAIDGTHNFQQGALVDMLCEGIRDARGVVVGYAFNQDKAAHVASIGTRIGKFMPVFEEKIKDFDNGARLGFIEGLPSVGGLCTADVLLAEFVHGLLPMVPDALDNYPRIAALHQQIIAMPSVAAYLASDKRFPFPTEGEVCDAYVANVNKVLHGR